MWGVLSDERMGLLFTIATGSRQRSHSRVRVRGTRDHILLSQIRDFPLRRLVRLSGLRWRYSNTPPHGMLSSVEAGSNTSTLGREIREKTLESIRRPPFITSGRTE
jgi:hypothetical protein